MVPSNRIRFNWLLIQRVNLQVQPSHLKNSKCKYLENVFHFSIILSNSLWNSNPNSIYFHLHYVSITALLLFDFSMPIRFVFLPFHFHFIDI
uniref:Uncharacterized protein n=1 Tax=Utricularia reniformis TaxID=192314 RepID=A0A1Y0B4D8_9LAMI|nr:hypothetical protein AEK19_MT2131 [Utricularia reniformis]ART32282.1 hypothetical protein AEK19_MT2131 [Utricularia reniformis]